MDGIEFKQLENAHLKGNLIKICQGCGKPYRPGLKTYNKKIYNTLENPIMKLLRDGTFVKQKIEVKKKKVPVGLWMLSKFCEECIKNGELKRK